MTHKNFDLREEMQTDIHEMKPKWWMRWGIMTVFLVLSLILLLGYVVKYPDVIQSNFRLTTNKPSITLPLSSGSQIDKIFIPSNSEVNSGDHILILKNDSDYEDVISIKKRLQNFSFAEDSIINFFNNFIDHDFQLGSDIDNEWTALSTEILAYYNITKLNSYQSQIGFADNELAKLFILKGYYENHLVDDLAQQQLLHERFKLDSTMFRDALISKLDFMSKKTIYLQKLEALEHNVLALERLNLDITRLQNSKSNYSNNEKITLLERKLNIRKSISKLKTKIAAWERKNILISPIKGTVSFIQNIKENGFYEGKAVVITPYEKDFYAAVNIPLLGAGKVEKGQNIVLKLNDYPYKEYGTLGGTLVDFSAVAGENFYLGRVELNIERITSFERKINIKENMSGTGDIITKDRSIIGRLFEKITYAFNR